MASPWTTPADLRDTLRRRWESQRLLREWALGDLSLPYTLPLRRPRRADLGARYPEVRAWIDELRAEPDAYDIEWEEVRSREVGDQRLPRRVSFRSAEGLFGFIGKVEDYRAFTALHQASVARWPAVGPVLARMPHAALAQAACWPSVLAVVQRFADKPWPGCYMRELDVAGVDSKFIEERMPLLAALLDAVLPKAAIREGPRGARWFEERYGLRSDPPLVRFRILDPALAIGSLTDLSVTINELRGLRLDVDTVFVTENKVNGLAFPPVARAMVFFGLGYGVPTLFDLEWLGAKRLVYWGDIDTHGFAMLAALRRRFPATEAMLMDEATLLASRAAWVSEPEQELNAPPELSEPERAVFASLAGNYWAAGVRLEQERVPIGRVRDFIARAGLRLLE